MVTNTNKIASLITVSLCAFILLTGCSKDSGASTPVLIPITDGKYHVSFESISPNERYLVYGRTDKSVKGSRSRKCIMDMTTGETSCLSYGDNAVRTALFPDQPLERVKGIRADLGTVMYWSPDSSQYISSIYGEEERWPPRYDFVVDVASQEISYIGVSGEAMMFKKRTLYLWKKGRDHEIERIKPGSDNHRRSVSNRNNYLSIDEAEGKVMKIWLIDKASAKEKEAKNRARTNVEIRLKRAGSLFSKTIAEGHAWILASRTGGTVFVGYKKDDKTHCKVLDLDNGQILEYDSENYRMKGWIGRDVIVESDYQLFRLHFPTSNREK